MKFWIFIIHALLIFSACSEREMTQRRAQDIFEISYSNTPTLLEKENSSCNSFAESNFLFYFFTNRNLETRMRDFSLILNDKKVIRHIFHGEKSELIEHDGRFMFVTRKKPLPVDICSREPRRETVESAALTVSWYIHKSFTKFHEIAPEVKVSPIILNISPSIQKTIIERNSSGRLVRKLTFMTDNAFYMPFTKSITFLPHSNHLKLSGFDVNFWEVPTVASHEYGHHLFQTLFESGISAFEGCFGPAHKSRKENKQRGFSVSVSNVNSAFNEGFADLLAWYTLPHHERNLEGVRCLEKSRDIGSSVFYDGKPKIFSEEALRIFFTGYDETLTRSCEDLSYSDTHTFGAIFAHNVDSFLNELTVSDDEKLAVVIEWVKFLKTQKSKYRLSSGESYFRATFAGFIRLSVKKFGTEFNEKICRKIESIFPDLNLTECMQKEL